jgi:hypothetical protein
MDLLHTEYRSHRIQGIETSHAGRARGCRSASRRRSGGIPADNPDRLFPAPSRVSSSDSSSLSFFRAPLGRSGREPSPLAPPGFRHLPILVLLSPLLSAEPPSELPLPAKPFSPLRPAPLAGPGHRPGPFADSRVEPSRRASSRSRLSPGAEPPSAGAPPRSSRRRPRLFHHPEPCQITVNKC